MHWMRLQLPISLLFLFPVFLFFQLSSGIVILEGGGGTGDESCKDLKIILSSFLNPI